MRIWQADFYRRPLQDETGKPLWELLICDSEGSFQFSAVCRQGAANSNWLASQLQQQAQTQNLPDLIQVFRPQSLGLIEAAGQSFGCQGRSDSAHCGSEIVAATTRKRIFEYA
jgi:hypothetical protein